MTKYIYNFSKLKGKIIEKFGTVSAFAEALNSEISILSGKLNNKRGITKTEIIEWSNLLEIPLEEVGLYFFVIEV